MFDMSGFGKYNALEDDYVVAITDELSEQDRHTLHRMLKEQGKLEWLHWLCDNVGDAERYLSETTWFGKGVRQRSQLKELDDTQRLRCAYGAIWLSQMAAQLGPWMHDYNGPGSERHPDQRASIGAIGFQAFRAKITAWPFDSPEELTDPFVNET